MAQWRVRQRRGRKTAGIALGLMALSLMLLGLAAGSVSQWSPSHDWGWSQPTFPKPTVTYPASTTNVESNISEVNVGVDIDNFAAVDNSGFSVTDISSCGGCGYSCGGCGTSGDHFNDLQDFNVKIGQLSQVSVGGGVVQGMINQ